MYVHVLYDTVRSRCDFDDTADVVPISYRRMSTNEKKCVYVINISTERHYSLVCDRPSTNGIVKESNRCPLTRQSRTGTQRHSPSSPCLRLVRVLSLYIDIDLKYPHTYEQKTVDMLRKHKILLLVQWNCRALVVTE